MNSRLATGNARRACLRAIGGVLLAGALGAALAPRAAGARSATPHAGAPARPEPAAPGGLEEVPYVKTPDNVVDTILRVAAVGPGDRLLDLGSGDGRIVITAARRFGTPGTGIEIDPSLVTLSNELAARAGVAGLARFLAQDLFETDLSGATVVTLYLLPDVNLALRPRLLATLAPGTRVVSHDWDMGDWRPDASVVVDVPDKPVGREKRSTVHLWVIPARVDGAWTLRTGAPSPVDGLRLGFAQRFQQLELAAEPGKPWRGGGRLDGEALSFTLGDGARTLRFEGRVRGEAIEGRVEIDGRSVAWRATRG